MQRDAKTERVEDAERARVVIADRTHEESVVDALVLAFSRDPIARYAFPGPTQHRAGFRSVVLGMGGAALDHRSAFATEGFGGVALWLPPGVGVDEAVMGEGMERYVPADRRETMTAMMEEMGRLHPDEPHWYLPLIGVDPAAQDAASARSSSDMRSRAWIGTACPPTSSRRIRRTCRSTNAMASW